jgi:hypothetical protein
MIEALICLTDHKGFDQWVGGVAGELRRWNVSAGEFARLGAVQLTSHDQIFIKVKRFFFSRAARPVLGPIHPPVHCVRGIRRGSKTSGSWRWPLLRVSRLMCLELYSTSWSAICLHSVHMDSFARTFPFTDYVFWWSCSTYHKLKWVLLSFASPKNTFLVRLCRWICKMIWGENSLRWNTKRKTLNKSLANSITWIFIIFSLFFSVLSVEWQIRSICVDFWGDIERGEVYPTTGHEGAERE